MSIDEINQNQIARGGAQEVPFTKLTLCEDQSEVFIVWARFSRTLKLLFLASCLKTVGFSHVEANADSTYACVCQVKLHH